MERIALVDLANCAYKTHFYYAARYVGEEGEVIRPIWHIVCLHEWLQGLYDKYQSILLCCDPVVSFRKVIFSGYKAGRLRDVADDPVKGFNIMGDLDVMLSLFTGGPNVYAVRGGDLEADDVIASWLWNLWATGVEVDVYSSDKDVLLNPGPWHWFPSMVEGEVNRIEYLGKVTGGGLYWYLPLLWKVVRGDVSDNIVQGVKRFPGSLLRQCCDRSCRDWTGHGFPSFEFLYGCLRGGDIPAKWVEAVEGAREQLSLNYELMRPRVVPITDFELVKSDPGIYAEFKARMEAAA